MTQIGPTTYYHNGANSIVSAPVAWPTGAADGDLAILMYSQERSAVFPAGHLPGWNVTVGGDASHTMLIAWKFIVPADLLQPVTIGTLTSTRRAVAALEVHRGVGAPTVQAGTIIAASGSVPPINVPAITASAANGIVLSVMGLRSTGVGSSSGGWVRTVTPNAAYTEHLDQSTTAVNANAILHVAAKPVTVAGVQASVAHTVADTNTQVVPYAIYIPEGNVRLATPVVTLGAKTNASYPGATDGSQVISWAAVPNASAYTVEVAVGAAATTGFTVRSTAAVSPYTVDSLGAGTYTYAVTATP
jgi:hypothetical protein